MTSNLISTPPSVSWAQRSSRVFLTFNVECEKPDFKIEKKAISFKGTCAPDNKPYEVIIPLYAEIDPERSNFLNKGRLIEVYLTKDKSDEPFWPYLTSDKLKHHWLKIDFERWQDEDDEGNAGDEFNEMNDLFANKMEIADGADDKDDSSSSEEEDLPDVQ